MSAPAAFADAHRQSQARVHYAAGLLTPAQFNRRPEPDAWSVGEVVAHLTLVAEGLVPRLEAVVERARAGSAPFRHGVVSRRIRRALEPGTAPLQTSAGAMPTGRPYAPVATLARFDGFVERYVAVCERAAGLDLRRTRVRFSLVAPVPLSLGAYLDISGAHALRHAAQAERVAARIAR